MVDGEPSISFPDHFSGHAADYARFRPDYPGALFDYLAGISPARRMAWDCATGNGQAARALADRFARVVATDASAGQIAQAVPHPRVEYRVAPAEASGLPDGAADLVTVAQALHWFDRPLFWEEARRVLAPEGVIAVWAYDLVRVDPGVDAAVRRLAREIVGPFWPPERHFVDDGYAAIELPFEEISAPDLVMEKLWVLSDLRGYLRTWSATRRYVASVGEDPLSRIEPELAAAWGDPGEPRRATWTLDLRVGLSRARM
ncbi:MAG: class I SAM-dependent methyltransferase [Thermoanaerobaculia bacterium]